MAGDWKNKKIIKLLIIFIILIVGFILADSVFAQLGLENEFAEEVELGEEDIGITVARIIRAFLGVLGIIAVVIIIYGGYLWMTSGGNEEKVSKAKKLLISAAIGLVIILSAFAITQFILSRLGEAVGIVPGEGDNVNIPGYVPGEDDLYVKNIFPQGDVAIQNPVAKIFFSRNIDEATIEGNISVSKVTADGEEETEGNFSVVGSRVEFRASAQCFNDQGIAVKDRDGNDVFGCFEPFQQYKIEATETVIKSTGGKELRCGLGENACLAYFTPGNIIDIDPPSVEIISIEPSQGRYIPNEYPVVITARAKDDSGITNVDFYINDSLPQDGTVFEEPYEYYWDASLLETGSEHILMAQAFDLDDHSSDSSTKKVIVRSAHCFNNEQDEDETGVDCGGADCGNCSGDSCTDHDDCASGACIGGVCREIPIIDYISPEEGAEGNYITVGGRYFGDVRGEVIFMGQDTDGNGDALGDADDKTAPLAECTEAWKANSVVVEVPEGAATGPIKLAEGYSGEGFWYRTDMPRGGGYEGEFTVNPEAVAPGICSIVPDEGQYGDEVVISGIKFGDNQDDSKLTIGVESEVVSWSDISIIANVPNVQEGRANVWATVQGQDSNYLPFTVKAGPQAPPTISDIDPDRGPANQYVTLSGANFGAQVGKVEFSHSQLGTAEAELPVCDEGFWRDGSVIIKVPTAIEDAQNEQGLNPSQDWKIRLTTAEGQSSNEVDFTFISGEPTPGLCSIDPVSGPPNIELTAQGEGFGRFIQGESRIKFTPDQYVTNFIDWNNKEITGALVPLGAQTGPLSVVVGDPGVNSNSINFEVKNCQTVDEVCEEGTECCGDGACRKECEEIPALCTYNWSFTTGKAVIIPQVAERAGCLEDVQSPSPYKNSTDACINIKIAASFNTDMQDDTFNASNIILRECNEGDDFDEVDCDVQIHLNFDGLEFTSHNTEKEGFVAPPSESLNPNTWYQVTLKSGSTGLRGVNGLPLDGTFTNQAGVSSDYVWAFKIRDNDEPCKIDHIEVTPPEAVIEYPETQQDYTAVPLAENCNFLTGDYDWQWEVVDLEVATVGFCQNESDRACNSNQDCPNPATDQCLKPTESTTTATAVGPSPPTTRVNASAENKSDFGKLKVIGCITDEDCNTGCYIPNNDSLCINNACTPVIDTFTPNNGAIGTWTAITGCYFGEKKGSVKFLGSDVDSDGDFEDLGENSDDRLGLWPDETLCGDVWKDQIILTELPNATTTETLDDAIDGPIKVITQNKDKEGNFFSDQTTENFDVNNEIHPVICRLVPDHGKSGDTIEINGNHFGDEQPAEGRVDFVGVEDIKEVETINKWSNQSISVNAPEELGDIKIITDDGSYTDALVTVLDDKQTPINEFSRYYLDPYITSLSPDTGPLGAWLTVRGGNFGIRRGSGYVDFYAEELDEEGNPILDEEGNPVERRIEEAGLPAYCGNLWTDTQIITKVPENSSLKTGLVKVTTDRNITTSDEDSKIYNLDTELPIPPGICRIENLGTRAKDDGEKTYKQRAQEICSNFYNSCLEDKSQGICSQKEEDCLRNYINYGYMGDEVAIKGDRLSNQGPSDYLYFNSLVEAAIDSWSDEQINSAVPEQATSGPVYVTKRIQKAVGRHCEGGVVIAGRCVGGDWEEDTEATDISSNELDFWVKKKLGEPCSQNIDCDTNCCDDFSLTCAEEWVCSPPEPQIIERYPADGQDSVCRNTQIYTVFDRPMDLNTLGEETVFVAGFYGGEDCPSGTTKLSQLDKEPGLLKSLLNKFASIFYKIFGKTASAQEKFAQIDRFLNEPASIFRKAETTKRANADIREEVQRRAVDLSRGNWCAVSGTIITESVNLDKTCSLTQGETCDKEAGCECKIAGKTVCRISKGDTSCNYGLGTKVIFQADNFLNGGSEAREYMVLVKGEEEGVKSAFDAAMTADESWSFNIKAEESGSGVRSGVCLLERVKIEPSEPSPYMFSSSVDDEADNNPQDTENYDTINDSDKLFVSTAYSKDDQKIVPMSGYDWSWDWASDDRTIVDLEPATVSQQRIVRAQNKNGKTQVVATATITEDEFFGTVDEEISGLAEIEVFLCQYPWPARDSFPFRDRSNVVNSFYPDMGGDVDLSSPFTNFRSHYCRGNTIPGDNLLLNSSFEKGLGAWYLGGQPTEVVDEGVKGQKAVSLTKKPNVGDYYIYQPLGGLKTNKTYTASVHFKADSGIFGELCFDSKEKCSQRTADRNHIIIEGDGNWKRMEISLLPEEMQRGIAYVYLYVGKPGGQQAGQAAVFDAVQVEEGGTTTDYKESDLLPSLIPTIVRPSASQKSCSFDDECSINEICEFGRCQSRVLKEFFFRNPVNDDAVGIRIMKNPEHLKPSIWYQDPRNVPNPGSPQSIAVDCVTNELECNIGYECEEADGCACLVNGEEVCSAGLNQRTCQYEKESCYDGVRDGRTIYVNASNGIYGCGWDSLEEKDEYRECFTNIYIISYNQGASDQTVDMFNQIFDNWHFNINLKSDSWKGRLIRDTIRLSDKSYIKDLLFSYNKIHDYYPKLEAGTFVVNNTFSTWPSWQSTLGNELGKKLPVDPINKFGPCPGYDQMTCWNEERGEFFEPNNSLVYKYVSKNNGQNYTLTSDYEYSKEGELCIEETEICDGYDNDCDNEIDEGCDCIDGDTKPCGKDEGICEAGEQVCRSGQWGFWPAGVSFENGIGKCSGRGAELEDCDGLDNDCDGKIDEDLNNVREGTSLGICQEEIKTCVDGKWQISQDGIGPSEEICDGLDNDCDGQIDEELVGDVASKTLGPCQGARKVCFNGSWVDPWEVSPLPPEWDFFQSLERQPCDGLDNDCDGEIDEDVTTWYKDEDGDGFGDFRNSVEQCAQPSGYVDNSDDCDDGNASIYPEAPESCDGIDNDCDGLIDENVTTVWYKDNDNDGYGDEDNPLDGCEEPAGFVANSDDCNDFDDSVHPGADDICDGEDNDCDGEIDEDALCRSGYMCYEGSCAGCGDGIKQPNPPFNEECDGPMPPCLLVYGGAPCEKCVSCNIELEYPPYCGDGTVQEEYGEECDPPGDTRSMCLEGTEPPCLAHIHFCNDSCKWQPNFLITP